MDVRSLTTTDASAPHGGGPVLVRDTRRDSTQAPAAAVIMLHGRGGSARDILGLATSIGCEDVVYLAPQASGNSWYPRSFLADIADNQPGLDSAHSVVETLIKRLGEGGVDAGRVALLGFSQGACVATDHAMRFPRRYGAIVALTGGVIGPPGSTFAPRGDLAGTPTFLGSSDPDPHVPAARVRETADLIAAMGGKVETRLYPGMAHTVCEDEIEVACEMIRAIR